MVSGSNTIYILLSHSGSMFSKAINICTRDPYTHVSIALDVNLNELYSFGRINPYNPIIGGFVKEDVINGTYGRFPNTKCALYSLEINDIQYKKLKKELYKFYRESERYRYNLLGVVSAAFNYPLHRKYSYFCSQFVSEVLLNSGIDILHKNPSLTSPMDFLSCEKLQFVYEGYLSTYSKEANENLSMQL